MFVLMEQIRNKVTGMCLDTFGRKAGEKVGMADCHGLGGNQVCFLRSFVSFSVSSPLSAVDCARCILTLYAAVNTAKLRFVNFCTSKRIWRNLNQMEHWKLF